MFEMRLDVKEWEDRAECEERARNVKNVGDVDRAKNVIRGMMRTGMRSKGERRVKRSQPE